MTPMKWLAIASFVAICVSADVGDHLPCIANTTGTDDVFRQSDMAPITTASGGIRDGGGFFSQAGYFPRSAAMPCAPCDAFERACRPDAVEYVA